MIPEEHTFKKTTASGTLEITYVYHSDRDWIEPVSAVLDGGEILEWLRQLDGIYAGNNEEQILILCEANLRGVQEPIKKSLSAQNITVVEQHHSGGRPSEYHCRFKDEHGDSKILTVTSVRGVEESKLRRLVRDGHGLWKHGDQITFEELEAAR